MMHIVSTVVALVDANNKPFREYESVKHNNNGRKAKVIMPFDTEYKLRIKNSSDKRLRLEIEIDGTIVSGSGIVVSAYDENCYIERFVETQKKFKFVKASNEAVSDPTSRENGIIKVRVAKESIKLTPITEKIVEHHIYHDYWNTIHRYPYWLNNGVMYGGCFGQGNSQNIYNHNLGASGLNGSLPAGDNNVGPTPESVNSYFSQTAPQPPMLGSITTTASSLTPPASEAGATIEGSASAQVFGTTDWNGDAEVSYFTFQVSGKDLKNDPEYQAFLRLKEKFGE